MRAGSQRTVLGLALLAGAWVAAYWLWNAREPGVTFDDLPPAAATDPRQGATAAPAVRKADAPPPSATGGSPARAPVPDGGGVAALRDGGGFDSHDPSHGTSSAPPQSQTTAASSKTPEPVIYTVQSGDTLSSIAKRFYGRESAWERIYEANRDVLPDKDTLRLGDKLRIPPSE